MRQSHMNIHAVFLYSWIRPVTLALSLYLFQLWSTSNWWLPNLAFSATAVAVSSQRTDWSVLLRIADGTFNEIPKRSLWISWPSNTANLPNSSCPPIDHTCGLRVAVSVSLVEYWILNSAGPRSGDS